MNTIPAEGHKRNPNPDSVKIEWVDYAKGIGIILVVYGHVARGLVSAGIMSDSIWYRAVDAVIYGFHMPLFFFLSGLWLESSLARRGKLRLFANKIDTIVYPFVAWSLLQFSVEASLSSLTNGKTSWGDVWSIFLDPIAHFWFLYALFIITMAAAFFFPRSRFKATILAAISAGLYFVTSDGESAIQARYISANLVFFVAGALICRPLTNMAAARPSTSAILLAGSILTSIAIYSEAGVTRHTGTVSGLILAGSGITFSIGLASLLARAKVTFIYHIGLASMAIYLAHILAGSGMRIALGKLLGIDSVALHLVAGIAAGVLIPLAMFKAANLLRLHWLWRSPNALSAERVIGNHPAKHPLR